ncbi:serine/threonine protein kinase [Thalassoglobus polymorphus]|uniref:Serine/threonine-protein kinase PknB n=1 Tax=Thalassoglobus polymorphus TaxID=2527994 RepID=A0A517QI60_9PLAN|nr:serine/threonine-protein kinase [Thalassoglobus polymorphus]QDT31320.1 Serine/threonine-protein kinase PknB [Thalassoglobus polymorphus]
MEFLKRLFNKEPRIEKVDVEKRFQLLTRVGQGSMSKVWKATDPRNNDLVAVKVLDRAKLARLQQRFVGLDKPSEGQIASVLNHPNVARTISHGITTNNEEFLVMEFIEGDSMSYLVETQNARMKENCIWYCIQLGEGLNYLHTNDWIHRDLCPRNIVVTKDDLVKIIDFGLMVPNTPEFRRPGNRTGTANYMAPELILRQPTDQRIDIFSYAVTCYEMYTGELPWPAADTMESVLHHVNQPPEDIRQYLPDLDEQIANAIMTGLEKKPDDRWRTVQRMVNEFREAGDRLYPDQ